MILKGDIVSILFRNDENGYTIIKIDCKGEIVSCVGTFPPVSDGESVEVTGSFTIHPRFGKQFKVENVQAFEPESLKGIERFLSSKVLKGIGPATAKNIVDAFKKDTLKILEFKPYLLANVKNISKNKAKLIGEQYQTIKVMRETVMFLQNLGIGLNLAFKIYKVYGTDTRAVIKTNPYLLIEDVDRVGFLTADKIARESGIKADSNFRVRAGILFTLKEAATKNGNTYLPFEELLELSVKLLNAEVELVKNNVESLLYDQKIKKISENGNEGIMLTALYRVEKTAATKLSMMVNTANAIDIDASSLVDEFEKKEKLELHSSQREAVLSSVRAGVSVITGGPGTGKTTIIKCIMYIFNAWRRKTMLMAPTGRAAKRLSDQTKEPASTIHRALMQECTGEPFLANAIIIDEVSMVDVFLLGSLLDKIKNETQLVLVGDKDQLPSVGAGNVLADILSSNMVPVSYLSHVYRQEEQSLIVTNAHAINNGLMPNLESKDRDFFFVEALNSLAVAEQTISLISKRLPQYLQCEPSKIQILCPMKATEAGTIRLNEKLADIINKSSDKKEAFSEGQRFRVGDKVMHIANNYELTWQRSNGKFVENGKGVFNGDAGQITNINLGSNELTVLFEDGREATYTPDVKSQLVLSYAITIHKSQGSEFDACIIPLVSGSYTILTRNLLYTAITRAKKLVVIVGDRALIKKIINNNYIQKRYSFLKSFMIETNNKTTLLYNK